MHKECKFVQIIKVHVIVLELNCHIVTSGLHGRQEKGAILLQPFTAHERH